MEARGNVGEVWSANSMPMVTVRSALALVVRQPGKQKRQRKNNVRITYGACLCIRITAWQNATPLHLLFQINFGHRSGELGIYSRNLAQAAEELPDCAFLEQ